MPTIYALIPARSGSKSLPHKNIRLFAGRPLLAWSIEQARESQRIQRVLVSTDSKEYAEIARQYGAETPFLRPKHLARDTSTDLETFLHATEWLKQHEGRPPDIWVHLRPTTPVRRPGLIDEAIRLLSKHPNADSVRSIARAPLTPYKMWRRERSGMLKPLLSVPGMKDPWNQARQVLPEVWTQTGAVDVLWTKTLLRRRSMTGKRILGLPEQSWADIDTEKDFVFAEFLMVISYALWRKSSPDGRARTFCFDLDGVIAETPSGLDYRRAKPRRKVVALANRLKEAGHRIIVHTARGSVTGLQWAPVTRAQLRAWGLRYDELIMGKPAADYYIDDHGIHVSWLETLL